MVYDSLLEIAEFVAQDNPSRAFTFIEELEAFLRLNYQSFQNLGDY